MHESIRLIAIDWGTSSARAYALDANGGLVSERSAPLGIQRVTDGNFANALATLCGGAIPDGMPLLASGMIGSRQGWVEAPYCACPAGFAAIAAGLVSVAGTNLRIVPGLICRDGDGTPDVMRGEETQIFGALAEGDAAPRVIVLPGTHSKWAIVRDACVATFATFMTGELYAVLRQHSILGRLATDDADAAALAQGVRASLRDDAALSHDLFSARTLALTGALASEGVADYLSGLLLGAEIAAGRRWLQRQQLAVAPVTLIGDVNLCARYGHALELAGVAAALGPADAAARGLWKIAVHAGMLKR
ncbi:MAG: 2-dehydro-3-deoxygalactonokinase [Casimicrobiaceae bacterium]